MKRDKEDNSRARKFLGALAEATNDRGPALERCKNP